MKINFTPNLKMKSTLRSFFTTLFFLLISTFSYAQCGFLNMDMQIKPAVLVKQHF